LSFLNEDNAHEVIGQKFDNDTPLMLNVRACTQSYWTRRRSPDAVAALLKAGVSTAGVPFPCGYEAVDQLLEAQR
jgi:ankyrin repeat protein